MAKVDRKFGEIVRDCEKLKKLRAFTECTIKLTSLILSLEDESKKITRAKLVSQMELLSLAYNHRGQVLYLMVEFDKAIKDFSNALRCNPRMAAAFYNRGLIHYRMGRFEIAVKDLEEALKLNSYFEEARECLRASQVALKDGATVDETVSKDPKPD